MKIGIDIDNVISDFDDSLLRNFLAQDQKISGRGIVNKDAEYITEGMFSWPLEEVDNYYNKNIERIAKSLNVIPGAKEYIDRLREEGNIIYIITSRNNGEYSDPLKLTTEWLDQNEISYDHLILTPHCSEDVHYKAKFCLENGIKLMIDDSIEICIDCLENGISALLMDTPYNRNSNLQRVTSWKEIYNRISNDRLS